MGLQLDEDAMRKVTERIIELGDKKELVTQEDLPYIVSDVLKHGMAEERVSLKSYIVNLAYGLKPMATLKIEINGKEYEESSSGDGQYDAFVRALRKIYKVTLGRKFPMLTNYARDHSSVGVPMPLCRRLLPGVLKIRYSVHADWTQTRRKRPSRRR